jgi:hypothetical protein
LFCGGEPLSPKQIIKDELENDAEIEVRISRSFSRASTTSRLTKNSILSSIDSASDQNGGAFLFLHCIHWFCLHLQELKCIETMSTISFSSLQERKKELTKQISMSLQVFSDRLRDRVPSQHLNPTKTTTVFPLSTLKTHHSLILDNKGNKVFICD